MRGSTVPVEERRRMARAGQIDPKRGVFPRSPDKPEIARKPRRSDLDAELGDETNPMESPNMLSTEEIAEREREDVPDRRQRLQFGKSRPFGAAWAMLKEDEKFKPEPSRQLQLDGSYPKGHPSTSYGMQGGTEKDPDFTRKPTASLRTGRVPAQASQEDMDEFMRINSAQEHQDMLEAESLSDGKRSPADEMRLDGLRSAFARPDKAYTRLSIADEMHGQDIQNIFEEQGIPVRSSVGRDAVRNQFEPRRVLDDDNELYLALRELSDPKHRSR